MPIRTQLLKKWVGPDPEKHVGSTPLVFGVRNPSGGPKKNQGEKQFGSAFHDAVFRRNSLAACYNKTPRRLTVESRRAGCARDRAWRWPTCARWRRARSTPADCDSDSAAARHLRGHPRRPATRQPAAAAGYSSGRPFPGSSSSH